MLETGPVTLEWMLFNKELGCEFPGSRTYSWKVSITDGLIIRGLIPKQTSELLTCCPEGTPSCTGWPPRLLPGQCCAAGPLLPPTPASCPPGLSAASTARHTEPDLKEQREKVPVIFYSSYFLKFKHRFNCLFFYFCFIYVFFFINDEIFTFVAYNWFMPF